MSALQLSRMLGLSYESTWFMCHRIRESMTPASAAPIGGENKVVESDETFIGGKAKNRAYAKKEPKKHHDASRARRSKPLIPCRQREGQNATRNYCEGVSRKSYLMTDELASYEEVGKEFSGHGTVNHSADEYVRLGGFVHVNTAECRFSLMKRAVFGTHHSISEAHLPRYLAECDFKWNTRNITDGERAALALKGAEGKRLTYHGPDRAAHC